MVSQSGARFAVACWAAACKISSSCVHTANLPAPVERRLPPAASADSSSSFRCALGVISDASYAVCRVAIEAHTRMLREPICWPAAQVLEQRLLFPSRHELAPLLRRPLQAWLWEDPPSSGHSGTTACPQSDAPSPANGSATRYFGDEVALRQQFAGARPDLHGGEELEAAHARYRAAFAAYAARSQGRVLLLVTHGEAVRAALGLAFPGLEAFSVEHCAHVCLCTLDGAVVAQPRLQDIRSWGIAWLEPEGLAFEESSHGAGGGPLGDDGSGHCGTSSSNNTGAAEGLVSAGSGGIDAAGSGAAASTDDGRGSRASGSGGNAGGRAAAAGSARTADRSQQGTQCSCQ